jgi:hypothetical protein
LISRVAAEDYDPLGICRCRRTESCCATVEKIFKKESAQKKQKNEAGAKPPLAEEQVEQNPSSSSTKSAHLQTVTTFTYLHIYMYTVSIFPCIDAQFLQLLKLCFEFRIF